jgi:hypothetical protein
VIAIGREGDGTVAHVSISAFCLPRWLKAATFKDGRAGCHPGLSCEPDQIPSLPGRVTGSRPGDELPSRRSASASPIVDFVPDQEYDSLAVKTASHGEM